MMNRQNIVTPDQKTVIFNNVCSADFTLSFGYIIAGMLSNLNDEVFGQRTGLKLGKELTCIWSEIE